MVILTAAWAAPQAAAANYDSDDAWVGATQQNPVLWSPKTLATKAYNLSYSERQKTFSDDGDWYQWNEPEDKDYDFFLFVFPDESPNAATLNWQVAIDHDTNKVHCFYWHGNNQNWVWVDENAGGRNPATKHNNVIAAFDNNGALSGIVIFLFVGYTPAAGDDWVKCDVADVDAD